MDASEVEKEIEEIRNKLNKAKVFIESSDNIQKEEFSTVLNNLEENISVLDKHLGTYKESQERINKLGEKKLDWREDYWNHPLFPIPKT
jgi:bacterioferritin (cytochrome b1)